MIDRVNKYITLYPVPISSEPWYLDLGVEIKVTILGSTFFSLFSNVVSSVRITGGKGAGVQLVEEPAGIQGG